MYYYQTGVTQLVHHYSCLLLHVLLPSIARSYHTCDISLTCFIINTNMADAVGLSMFFYMYIYETKEKVHFWKENVFVCLFVCFKQSCCMSQLSMDTSKAVLYAVLFVYLCLYIICALHTHWNYDIQDRNPSGKRRRRPLYTMAVQVSTTIVTSVDSGLQSLSRLLVGTQLPQCTNAYSSFHHSSRCQGGIKWQMHCYPEWHHFYGVKFPFKIKKKVHYFLSSV